MACSVSVFRTSSGWQVSLDRPGQPALLYGTFQSRAETHQADQHLRCLLATDSLDVSALPLLTWPEPDKQQSRPGLCGHQFCPVAC